MSDQGKATKEIVFWQSDDEQENVSASPFQKENMLTIGTFLLKHMARAYEKAQPGHGAFSNHDVVANHGGVFLVNLAREMGVTQVGTRVMSFVAQRLMENKNVVSQIRASSISQSLDKRNLHSKNPATDQELVERLVQKTVGFSS